MPLSSFELWSVDEAGLEVVLVVVSSESMDKASEEVGNDDLVKSTINGFNRGSLDWKSNSSDLGASGSAVKPVTFTHEN